MEGVVSVIKNRISKIGMVKWRTLKWFQGELKYISEESLEKLKRSIIINDFAMPFHVWKDKKVIWILDGHHRQKVMLSLDADGVIIPDLLPAIFVKCSGHKDAARLVLSYASVYAHVTDDGVRKFLEEGQLDLASIGDEVDFPFIDLNFGDIDDLFSEGSSDRKIPIIFCFTEKEHEKVKEVLEWGKSVKNNEEDTQTFMDVIRHFSLLLR
jgi:hypothetical protein